MKELCKILYVNEIIGKNLFEIISNHPELLIHCDKLIEITTEYEIMVLEGGDYIQLKQQVTEQIMVVNDCARNIPNYKQSELFFDELGNLTYLY